MLLTVGEISKALGMSTESIRYYVDEGLITPKKNEKNNYWEYSSDDLIRLTDILFYRSMDLNVREIKTIMDDLPLEKIGDVIDERKSSLIKLIREYTDSLWSLNDWGERYKQEMALVGNYEIGEMPPGFRRYGSFEEPVHMARYIEECFDLDKEDWGDVSISFFYNLNDEVPKLQRYLSIENQKKINPSNTNEKSIEEHEEHCLITEVHYNNDVMTMLQPMIDYAEEKGYDLRGEFYGRENTNYFVNGKRLGLYRVYAPFEN
jgi:DNA-binding transcriptional MerR regulator